MTRLSELPRREVSDRGRKRLSPSPPSEPCVRFSRTRLSSRWFPHRDWLASPQIAILVNNPCTAKKSLVSLDAVTQRRQHGFLSLRGFNSRPVWPLGLCVLFSPCGHYRRWLLALLRFDSLPSTFLPPVPRRCFAFSASRGSSPLRYHEGSDSYTAHLRRRSPHLLRHTFLSFRLQPRGLPSHRLPPRQRDPRVSDFAMYEQARRSSPPNRVRHPTDRLFASGCSPPRLATTQLPSASELWLTPTRTFTVLMQHPHGRTHSRAGGNPGGLWWGSKNGKSISPDTVWLVHR